MQQRDVPASVLAEWQAHTNEVLEHTLFRKARRGRGRLGSSSDDALFVAKQENALQRRKAMILGMINGDIGKPRFVHIEHGCCTGRADTCDKFFLALVQGVGTLLTESGLPAASRWGSLASSNSELQLAESFHAGFSRAFLSAFDLRTPGSHATIDDGAPADVDFRLLMQRKVYRVRKVLEDPGRRMQMLRLSYITEPLDHLLQRLQHLDESSSPLLDLRRPGTSPLHFALSRWADMVRQPIANSVLSSFFAQCTGGATAEEAREAIRTTQLDIFTMVCQVWWRLELDFEAWPWALAELVHPTCSDEDRLAFAEGIWTAPVCCLDVGMCRKIRAMYASASDMLADTAFMGALRLWARGSRVTNMHMERLLSLFRKTVPDKCPGFERFASAGFLAQILQEHLAAGGAHPAVVTRKELVADGAPIMAQGERPTAKPSLARGHLLLMSERCSAARAASGSKRVSRSEMASIRKEAMREWREDMSPEQRAEFNRRAVATCERRALEEMAQTAERPRYDDEVLPSSRVECLGIRSCMLVVRSSVVCVLSAVEYACLRVCMCSSGPTADRKESDPKAIHSV